MIYPIFKGKDMGKYTLIITAINEICNPESELSGGVCNSLNVGCILICSECFEAIAYEAGK
jgi:hypothetical protein